LTNGEENEEEEDILLKLFFKIIISKKLKVMTSKSNRHNIFDTPSTYSCQSWLNTNPSLRGEENLKNLIERKKIILFR